VVQIVIRTASLGDGAAQIKLKGNFDQSSILCLEYSIFTAFWGILYYALNYYLLLSSRENQLKLTTRPTPTTRAGQFKTDPPESLIQTKRKEINYEGKEKHG
jgi:hypothetical protein